MKLGVIADDLTGAGDIGGLLAKRGFVVRLHALGSPLSHDRMDVAVIDTDSRFDSPEIAAAKVREATRALQQWGADRFYKKTCSVFRGNVGPEFDALLDELELSAAPAIAAYPQNGRRTKDGIHFVHGRRLEDSPFADDPMHPRTHSDLVRLLRETTHRSVTLYQGGVPPEDGYALCDCETDGDLERLAHTFADSRAWLGSSALAEPLSRLWARPEPFDPLAGLALPPCRGVLIVAGSVMPQTRAQLQSLSAAEEVLTWERTPPLDALTEPLSRGEIVVLRSENSPEQVAETRRRAAEQGLSALEASRRIADRLAELAARAVQASGICRVIVLGGDTSASVCRALKIQQMLVYKEIEPGLPSTLAAGPYLLVLKSGSFGGPHFLRKALRHLDKIGYRLEARRLIAQLSIPEKVAQLQHNAPAIERLNWPAHNYWNECLHGVARNGTATVFPQAIGLAATWNPELLRRIAEGISTEARAKYVRGGKIYQGLTFWSPNLNMCRDPRWGRAQETYGEDPHLTSRLGVAFIQGLQGDDPRSLKLVATPKHLAVHSGPEALRHEFDARPGEDDLWDYYLPHFEAAVREGAAESIMTAYSRLNGEPCSSNSRLLQEILRERWGFDGFVVSDCDAIQDIHGGHGTVSSPAEAAARALRAGCDLECGCTFKHLEEALQQGLIQEPDLDRSLERVFSARLQLDAYPHQHTEVDTPEHRELAREAARQSMVLLQNDGTLPLAPDTRLAVLGPTADRLDVLLGNYNGVPSEPVTLREGFPEAPYWPGCPLTDSQSVEFPTLDADTLILCLGLTPELEGEEMDAGDRSTLRLPGVQVQLLRAALASGKKVVLVLTGGAALAEPEFLQAHAVVMAWYPGQAGGLALADLLWGHSNFSGKLPVTFYRDDQQLPAFEDYSLVGRTYRHLQTKPLWAFGHGLSYTRFQIRQDGRRFMVENQGERMGAEVLQLYENNRLVAFRRIELQPGQSQCLEL